MTTAYTPVAVASATGSADSAVLGGGGVDSGVGLLAVTGAGPGTLILAVAGLVSLVVGAAATLAGRQLPTRSTATVGLPDLSHRVADLG